MKLKISTAVIPIFKTKWHSCNIVLENSPLFLLQYQLLELQLLFFHLLLVHLTLVDHHHTILHPIMMIIDNMKNLLNLGGNQKISLILMKSVNENGNNSIDMRKMMNNGPKSTIIVFHLKSKTRNTKVDN